MERPKISDPKDRARVVRQTLEAIKLLSVLSEEVYRAGEDLNELWHPLRRARADLMEEVMLVPGVRIAVFPEDPKTEP